METNPQAYVQEAKGLMDIADSLLDKADDVERKGNYEVPIGPEYISHEDILLQKKIEPDFRKLDPKPNKYSDIQLSKDRGARVFCNQFGGWTYLMLGKKGKLRTGQETLDIIVSSGLATREDAKGVLASFIEPGYHFERRDDSFGYSRFSTLVNGKGKTNYKVGH